MVNLEAVTREVLDLEAINLDAVDATCAGS